jgi:hypothetical protein
MISHYFYRNKGLVNSRMVCLQKRKLLQKAYLQDRFDETDHESLGACVDRLKRDKREFSRHPFQIVVENNLFDLTELLKVLLCMEPIQLSYRAQNSYAKPMSMKKKMNLKTVISCNFCEVGDEESLMVRRELVWS